MSNSSRIVFQPPQLPDIFQRIADIDIKLKTFQRRTVQQTGLTPSQYFILGLLAKRDMRPLKELAHVSHCTRATMTGIVDTLEKKGLSTREPNPDDRRSLLLKLTEKGRQTLARTPSLENIFAGQCTGLSTGEIQQLDHLLKKLTRTLDVL